MESFIILLMFSFLDLADSSCLKGGYNNIQPQFGPGCMYRCHCVDDVQCHNITGNCSTGCAAGWMGPGCQYGDIAYKKNVRQLLYGSNVVINESNATEGFPTTCVGPAAWVEIDLNATYRISGLVMNSRDKMSLTGYEVMVGNNSFNQPPYMFDSCFNQTITHKLDSSTDVVCTAEIVGRYLLIRTQDNATTTTLCDVRVYGGRSLAYGHKSIQSSTTPNRDFGTPAAARAIDGNNDTIFSSLSCTHTEDEMSPWWRVNLTVVYNIARIVLYGRSDCCNERLSGFSVSFATNSSFNLVFSHPKETPPLETEVILLYDDYAQQVEISLKNITQALTLCEVFVFGDCQYDMCGWTCGIFCHCEGPIAKQNKIDANCIRGCKTGWWGHSCNNTCDSNCNGNSCNQRDGYCVGCSQGKWGHFCDNNCTNCLHGTGCGASDGICSAGCLAGRFGINCTEQCGQCADDRSCNRSSGVCIHGCLPGWHERNCTIACPLGWYGINCSNICGHCANKTCDHINGTCPFGCSEGYNGTRCSEPCPLGSYGKNCSNICGHCANKTCDHINGTCTFGCSEGYNGTRCYQPCPLGSYGKNCSNLCGHCANTTCDHINGTCTFGCSEGYNGTRCYQPCPLGWYGINCSNICGPCSNTTCDYINGTCPYGCTEGYNRTTFNESCPLGSYGITCSNMCGHCANTTCDHINGTCPFGCSEGYNGTRCSEPCPIGSYGINCSNICGHCANTTCEYINGTCPYRCTEGYNGTRCNETCPLGWYGINCSNICGPCSNTTCDYINGTCPLGCTEGYNGTRCNERLQQEITTTEASSSLPIGAPIGGVLGAVGLIVILALAIIAAKRRNSALRGDRYQSKEPEEHPSMQPTYENVYSNMETDRKRDLPVQRTEESGANIYVNINRNETEDIEMIIEEDTDKTLKSKAENAHDNTYYNIGKCSQRGGRRIAIHDLGDYITGGSHLLNNVEEEFKKLLSGPQHEMNIALNPENRQKNRYKGMYAYDKNRVILETLPDDPDTDYINASFINGYKRDNAYIAAQGTIAATVNDFWRMIWQYDVKQIVMLTGLIEQGKHKCLQYWPNDGASEYGMIRVELIDEDVCTEYVIRSFLISKTGSKKQKTVNQFHFTSWPDRGVPETSSSLVQFWKKVRHSGKSLDSPVLVHCSAGIGRTGTYIALDYSCDEGIEEGSVNIFECINKLRRQRIGLVQTAEQYVYLHAAVLEAFKDMVGHVSADDFQKYYTQMRGTDSGTKRIKLLAEFEKLQEDEDVYFGKRTTKDRNCEPKDEFLDGKLPENKRKNRCNNILPSERYRPYLSTYVRGHNDYINAVCLPTRKNQKGLLLTQMPLPDTVIDFWRLVYDYEVQSIVMLNEANLPGEAMGVYWPENDETSRHGPFMVKITSNVEKGSNSERMLEVSKHGEEQTLSLKQFICSNWRSNDSVPNSIDGFLNLIDDVEDWKRRSGERPILAHCMNGAERSGLFCVLWCVLERLKSDREVAIRSVVRQMRIRRKHIIPNFEQYKFCHDVVLFNLSTSTTYTNV